jgi:hypothetical protein
MEFDAIADQPEPAEFFATLAKCPDVQALDEAERGMLGLRLFRLLAQQLPSSRPEEVATKVNPAWRGAIADALPRLQADVRKQLTRLLDRGDVKVFWHGQETIRFDGVAVVVCLPNSFNRDDIGNPKFWLAEASNCFVGTIRPPRPLVYGRCAQCNAIMCTGGDARRRFCGDACALDRRRQVSRDLNRERRKAEKSAKGGRRAPKKATTEKPRR